MSLADHEIEEPHPLYDAYCSTHLLYYKTGKGCWMCADDEADRRGDEQREERGRR